MPKAGNCCIAKAIFFAGYQCFHIKWLGTKIVFKFHQVFDDIEEIRGNLS